jgi:hypothetical protein
MIEDFYSIIAEDKNVFELENNPFADYGYDDLGEASWEGQRLRGKLARAQGFDAVEMYDESGTSVLIPTGSLARKRDAAFDPQFKDSSNLLGSASPDLLRKTAIGGTAAVASPIALSFIEKRKQRPNSWISRKFNEAASSVVEPAMTVGNMIANDMTLSAGALGTGFLHNLADGFQRQGWTGAEQFVRPEQTPREFYDNSKLPVFMPPTEAGQQGLETLGNTLESISNQPLVRDTIDYWEQPLNNLDEYLRKKLGDSAVDNAGYLSNIVL